MEKLLAIVGVLVLPVYAMPASEPITSLMIAAELEIIGATSADSAEVRDRVIELLAELELFQRLLARETADASPISAREFLVDLRRLQRPLASAKTFVMYTQNCLEYYELRLPLDDEAIEIEDTVRGELAPLNPTDEEVRLGAILNANGVAPDSLLSLIVSRRARAAATATHIRELREAEERTSREREEAADEARRRREAEAARGAAEQAELEVQLAAYLRFDALSVEIPPESGWDVSSSVDPVTDEEVSTLVLRASTGRNSRGESVYLILRKTGQRTEVYVRWGEFLGLDTIRVTHRIDRRQAETEDWSISTDDRAAFHRGNTIGLVAALMGATEYIVRLIPYGENPSTASFTLAGLREIVMKTTNLREWYERYVRAQLEAGEVP